MAANASTSRTPLLAAGENPERQRWQPQVVLMVILVVGAALRLWLLSRGVPTPDSDESMVGLMALHVQHGEWTIFLWGQAYMGSLESLMIAPFLWLFGPSAWALHLAPTLVGLGYIASVYYLCAWLISRTAGLVAAAVLAVGSPFFVVLSMRSFGGYIETLLFGNLLLLLALRGAFPAGRTPRMVALFGVIIGLALWTNMLVGVYLVAAGMIAWWQRRVDLRQRNGVFLLIGSLVGASPAIIYNLMNHGATLTTFWGIVFNGANGVHLTPALALSNVWQFLTISLPILVGQGLGGTQSIGWDSTSYEKLAMQHPVIAAVNLFLVLVAIVLIISAAVPIARHWRSLFDATPDRARLRQQMEAATLIISGCYTIAFCLKAGQLFGTPRYLLPLFAALPLIVGQVERLVLWVVARHPFSFPVARVSLMLFVFTPVLLWNLAGDVALTPLQTAAMDRGTWVADTDEPLMQVLRAHNVHTFITNSYWSGFRLCFESNEAFIPYIIHPDGTEGFNRYMPYVTQARADHRPAYLNITGTPGMQRDVVRFMQGDMLGYTMTTVGIYTLFLPPAS